MSRIRDNAMIQIQDMYENGKPDTVFKTVKSFNLKITPFIILTLDNSLEFEIVVLVILNKMLVVVFDFYSGYGPRSQSPVFQFVPISNTQC